MRWPQRNSPSKQQEQKENWANDEKNMTSNAPMPTFDLFEVKTDNFTSITEGFGMKMDNQSNQFKLLNTKLLYLRQKLTSFKEMSLPCI